MKKALLRLLQPSLFAAFCLGVAMPAFAGDPIPGLDVKLGKPGGGGKAIVVKTDENGNFSFDNLAEGTYTVTISYDACVKAINTKGTGATVRQGSTGSTKFSLDCDDADGIMVADLDADGIANVQRKVDGDRAAVQSPRDIATGQASGKRMHKPFTITKEWGASTPMLSLTVAGGKKEFKGHVTLMK